MTQHFEVKPQRADDPVVFVEVHYDGIIGACKAAREKEPRLVGIDLEVTRISAAKYAEKAKQ